MSSLRHLLDKNRRWAQEIETRQPGFFEALSRQQAPKYVWIGCSDSRVPANEITGLLPGEIFVHRNVANLVMHTDLNLLSVLQFAVEVLRVEHVIVCGHYGCGGVKAGAEEQEHGLIDNWLRNIREVYRHHREQLDAIHNPDNRLDRLCELNVIEQVVNVCNTTVVQSAWRRGQSLSVHGWIYGIQDGLVRDLEVSAENEVEAAALTENAPR